MKCMVPEVGKVYPFYDDGKTGYSRQNLALVTRVIPFDSKEADFSIFGKPITTEEDIQFANKEKYEFLHKLKEYIEHNIKQYDWIFKEDTDYIVECAIPEYDEHLLYFIRTKYDGWFSIEVQTGWQNGFLDVERVNDEFLDPELKEKLDKNIL